MNLKNNGKNKDDINIMDTRVKPEYDKQGNEFLRNSSRITEEENLSSLSSSFTGLKNNSPLLFLPLYHQSSSNHLHTLPSYASEEKYSSFVFFMCGAKKHSHLLSSNKKGEYASSLLPSDILHLFTNKLKTLWRLTFKLSNE